jgi:DNA-binding NarL/FixJ family response regulator
VIVSWWSRLHRHIMRILIADDNEYVRRGVRSILASMTHWEICGEAKNGPEAIQSATELLPDFVLLDVSMPGISGLEVARILRDTVPATKILVMSQHDPAVLLPRAMEAGAHACIDKSRLATDLLPTIERVQAAQ